MNNSRAIKAPLSLSTAGALTSNRAHADSGTYTDSTTTSEHSWQAPRLLGTSCGGVFDHEVTFGYTSHNLHG